MQIYRRSFLGSALAGATAWAFPSLVQAQAGSAHVVVVGGGFGGATAARYLRLWEYVPPKPWLEQPDLTTPPEDDDE